MSHLRRPVIVVLSALSAVLVGGPAWGMVAPDAGGAAPKPKVVVSAAPRPKPVVKTPTTVTIQAVSKSTIGAANDLAVFRGVLLAPRKQALTQQKVVLLTKVKGARAWTRTVTAVSSAPDGKLLVAVSQDAPFADYKFVFDGQGTYKASTSTIVRVTRS
jgi:hypothetical protein